VNIGNMFHKNNSAFAVLDYRAVPPDVDAEISHRSGDLLFEK